MTTPTRPGGEPPVTEVPDSPQATMAIEAAGLARWFRSPRGVSTTGHRLASPMGQLSWALFDFARVPYILLVEIYIFAPYFTNVLVGDPVRGQALWGDIQGYAGLIIAALAPFIGAISDAGGRRKPWIALFAALVAVPAALLWFARADHGGLSIFTIGVLVAITYVAYEFSSVFYNAMLPSIVGRERIGGLSGLSLVMGNAGGLVLLLFMLICFSLPGHVHWGFVPSSPLFGIDQAAHEPERLSGPIAALCILVFAPLLMIFTPDRPASTLAWHQAAIAGFRSVLKTVRSLKHYRNPATYLLARLFFNDGMTAVLTFSGVYAAGTFHWGALQMMAYGITASIFAVAGGFFGGWLDDRFGSKAALFVSVGGTLAFAMIMITMGPDRILWVIPCDPSAPPVNGLPFFNTWPQIIFMGAVSLASVCVSASYANSRTMMARIAPVERMTEFFGLYSLSGQSTSFMATLSVGWLTTLTHSQRGGMIVILAFLLAGLIGMGFVREERSAAV